MMIKNFGARVEKVWEGLRPVTKKMIVGALQASSANAPTTAQTQKFSYDTQSDWEVSRLLTVLDEQVKDAEIRRDAEKLAEIRQLAETCVGVLEAQTGSAEVFIQLAERILADRTYHDHAVAETQLSVGYPALFVGHNHLLFKTKRIAQPFDRGRCFTIAKCWNHR